jgi:hypothetical protein
MKHQAPISKLQRSTKPQAPIGQRRDVVWMLEFEVSLELGIWNFDLCYLLASKATS